jgi:hypothetical protein
MSECCYPAERFKQQQLYTVCPCCDAFIEPNKLSSINHFYKIAPTQVMFFGLHRMEKVYYIVCECTGCGAMWAIYYKR